MRDLDLDAIFAAIRPPLVVHRAVIGSTLTPCGVHVTGAWGAITSLNDHRVTCPDCATVAHRKEPSPHAPPSCSSEVPCSTPGGGTP